MPQLEIHSKVEEMLLKAEVEEEVVVEMPKEGKKEIVMVVVVEEVEVVEVVEEEVVEVVEEEVEEEVEEVEAVVLVVVVVVEEAMVLVQVEEEVGEVVLELAMRYFELKGCQLYPVTLGYLHSPMTPFALVF